MAIEIPEGFKLVSREEFFNLLCADKRDIMPSTKESECHNVWMTPERFIWGYSYPGYKNPRDEKAYFVRK